MMDATPRPLAGVRALVTRAGPRTEPLSALLEAAGAEVRNLRYPPARPFQPSFSAAAIPTYRGSVRIAGEVAAGAVSPAVSLTYQACDETRCLPPVSVEVGLV